MARTSIARGPEALELEAHLGELGGARLEPVAGGLVELDHLGEQQRLAGDAAVRHRPAHPLEHQPLVGGVLVDEDQPVLGLGDDIGGGDLAAGDAERVAGLRAADRRGGFGAGGGGEVAGARQPRRPSLPRRLGSRCRCGSRRVARRWIPAFAGMTARLGLPIGRRAA